MIGRWILTAMTILSLASSASAQGGAWRFHWQPGQVMNYRVEQVTAIAEVIDGQQTETRSKLENTKKWQVLDVDAAGVATLRLSITALRLEMKTPSGDVMTFDSANLDASNAAMRTQMEKYLAQPLALIRVNPRGQVVEVKESKFGPASRFESEPPFVILLPEGEPVSTWERAYKMTLEPPQGTGEQYDATQKYECKSVKDRTATIALSTALKTQPEAPADQTPLFQMQPEGDVVFDFQSGMLQAARLHVDKQLKGHQGEGSSYHFQSSYSEQRIGEVPGH